jgi:hypothetical protein
MSSWRNVTGRTPSEAHPVSSSRDSSQLQHQRHQCLVATADTQPIRAAIRAKHQGLLALPQMQGLQGSQHPAHQDGSGVGACHQFHMTQQHPSSNSRLRPRLHHLRLAGRKRLPLGHLHHQTRKVMLKLRRVLLESGQGGQLPQLLWPLLLGQQSSMPPG